MKKLLMISFMFLLLCPGAVLAESLAQRVAGRILLDVQNHGEAWYVDPVSLNRYYLGRPDDAYVIMRSLGLGITQADFARFDSDLSLRKRLSGRIILQVEKNGEAWYVHPVTLKKYFLGSPTLAFEVMRLQSLGITSVNLSQIPMATTNISKLESYISVPFVPQAPYGEWSDLRQSEGCEEASVYMAVKWARGENYSYEDGKNQIIAMSDWEKEKYGYFVDTSARDTVDRLFKEYFRFESVELFYNISVDDIREQLKLGKVVIVPINGQTLGNPHYTGIGPLRHMIVIVGYDSGTQEFIINDPGTQFGENQRFSKDVIAKSLRDYVSGTYAPIGDQPSAMIVVSK